MLKATIPQMLGDMCHYLSARDFSLSHFMSDGRLNAAINEDEVISIIQENFDISVPRHRAWYDFAIETEFDFIRDLLNAETAEAAIERFAAKLRGKTNADGE